MKKILLLLMVTLMVASAMYGQRNCGSMEYLEQQMQEEPKRGEYLNQIENYTRDFIASSSYRAGEIVTIPVVVHVIYNNSTENISDAQVQSQIDILNEDFRRLNSDADNTWSQAADTEIEFCLASVDPNGNSTYGITRTSTSTSSFSSNDNMKFTNSGGKDAWPSGDYMNMWVCDLSGTLLGYAQFPGGPANTDGVVIDYSYFGDIGTATYPFNLGRTATHEVGHWLNLRHIWGDGGCGVDDYVSDTPMSDASNGGCSEGHVSCGSVDMVQNYMDYSDDACMNLYTAGQRDRMQALFGNGGSRASLLNSNGCGISSGASCNDGIQNGNETGVDCGGSCAPCPTVCNDNLIDINITFDNYPAETSWSLLNSSGQTVASGGSYTGAGSSISVSECLLDGCYDFVINDAYGDGICCGYGSGSYSVTGVGNTYVSGGQFGSSETTNFCLGDGVEPDPTCDDGVQNGSETGVDCGGPDCVPCYTCNDGVQNGNETGVDCGGPDCTPCATCNDGVQNGSETGVDCGGPDCSPCVTCNDGIQNGNETGVDCGGPDCAPCSTGCSENLVDINIIFDNYPSETSWSLINSSGQTVVSGGSYSGAGSSISVSKCLVDGCYDFVINDSYGDGICCSYGNGSYSITGDGGIYVSGGQFGSSETTNFCLGSSSDPDPTCDDGIQNGSETGVDCGGSCAPCSSGGSDLISGSYFESGMDGWIDGGSDCYRYSGSNSYEGNYSIRLRDDSNTSTLTSSAMNLTGYSKIDIAFVFVGVSMESGESFMLQYNDGSGYQTIGTYTSGSNFDNGTFYQGTVSIDASDNLVSNGRFRFVCDASSNSDYVYIDAVTVTGVNARQNGSTPAVITNLGEKVANANIQDLNLMPNPVSHRLTVESVQTMEHIKVFNTMGQLIHAVDNVNKNRTEINVQDFDAGIYFLSIETDGEVLTKRFIKN